MRLVPPFTQGVCGGGLSRPVNPQSRAAYHGKKRTFLRVALNFLLKDLWAAWGREESPQRKLEKLSPLPFPSPNGQVGKRKWGEKRQPRSEINSHQRLSFTQAIIQTGIFLRACEGDAAARVIAVIKNIGKVGHRGLVEKWL